MEKEIEKDVRKKAREHFSKDQAESVINRYNQRLVTILVDNYVPGLETVVFEGINGCGKDYFYSKLNEKFKEELDIDLPLFSSKPPLRDLKNLESFLKITEEGLKSKEVIELATRFLNHMEGVTADIAMSIKDNPEWTQKAFDRAQFNRKELVEGYIESKPTTKYVGIMRWTISNYIYCIQALLGTKEIKRLLDKYYEEDSYSAGFKSDLALKSLNDPDYPNLIQPMFLYELATNPKVIEFTRSWSQHVSSRKRSPLSYASLAPMDNLVLVSCKPSVAESRIKSRDKKDITTDSHSIDSLRFTYLMFNVIDNVVIFKGHSDEYRNNKTSFYSSMKDQVWTISYFKDRVKYAPNMEKFKYEGYSYKLTELIQLLRAMFDVDNINLITVEMKDNMDNSEMDFLVDLVFRKIVNKEREDHAFSLELLPSVVRSRI